jgi:ankyrin repeat protein
MKEESSETFLSEQDEGFELFSYIESGDIYKIDNFLNNKPNIWEYRDKSNDNSTVLHISVFNKSYIITEMLIEYCEKNNKSGLSDFINATNDKGVTALHYASFVGDIKIIKLLIDKGKANLDIKTKRGLNIIHYSAQGNKPNSLMYFYIKLKDDNISLINKLIKEEDEGGSTPLHWAAYSNAEDVLMYLINLDIFQNEKEKQDYINKTDNQGYTPLHLSVSSKSRRIVMKLLQSGANADIKDNKKRTPLNLAESKGYKEIIDILKNNKSCQACNVKAPVKQIKKSKKNIILVFVFQCITIAILYFSLISIALNKNDEIYIFKICCFFIYNIFFLFFFIIYFILLLKDPGEMKKESINKLKELFKLELEADKKSGNLDLTKFCYKCFIKKINYSKHCIVCDKCYEDFDHHCFWINKCVAKNNYNFFISFLVITFLYLLFVLIICILGIIYIIKNDVIDGCIFEFLFIKLENYFSIIFGKNTRFYQLGLNILLLIINLFFIIPETILLFLHLNVCYENSKQKKKRRLSSIQTSLIDKSVDSLEIKSNN